MSSVFTAVFCSAGILTIGDSADYTNASPLRVSNKWENGPEFREDFYFFIRAIVFATTLEIAGFLWVDSPTLIRSSMFSDSYLARAAT